ncbi:MAG: DUF177 domain-containing protein [Gammaproteobacteria bacterium]|nr:DUF177 domain-containing protein [Gammaproteobacteria bacterium]NVK87775.1 DUF177 domain-containing protein [Gammaproteobacteria bacterium]
MQNADVSWSINPFKLAENSAKTQRELKVTQLARFREYLSDDSGVIHAELSGYIDEDRRKLMRCCLRGQVYMACQTTFKEVAVEIASEVVFYPVLSEEAMASAPEEYEAVLYDSEELDLISLIEDELILTLPIAVNAPESPEQQSFGPKIVEQSAAKPNPFAVLAQLKKNTED